MTLGYNLTIDSFIPTDNYDMLICVGELAHDYGFQEGYFLYDHLLTQL